MASVTVSRLSTRKGKEARDWDAVYDLCCRTGNNGQPVAPERWGFFGRIWVGPCEKIFSQWTYAAEAENVVVGYLTGCPDSRGFTKAKLWRFALPLLVISAAVIILRTGTSSSITIREFAFTGRKNSNRLSPNGLPCYSTIQITKATALSAESNSRSFSIEST
jgi:hypothetical protein